VKNSTHTAAYRAFRKKLVTARKEAGLTQKEVSVALKQPQSYVSKCESGEKRVDIVELQKFAKLYKKEITFFLP
jgi:transcriptional regulator with XRE-family HTH domain